MGHNDRTSSAADRRRLSNYKQNLMDQRAPQLNGPNIEAAYQKALALAELGIWVFPAQRDKRPYKGSKSFKEASTDPVQILALWARYPAVYVAVWPRPSGLLDIDIDQDPELGKFGEQTIEEEGLEMPTTFSYPSQSGTGRHHIYEAPDPAPRAKNGIRTDIDRKSTDSHFIWYGDVPESRDVFKAPAPWMLEGSSSSEYTATGEIEPWGGRLDDLRDRMQPGVIPAELDFHPADFSEMESAVKVLAEKAVIFPETEGLRSAFDQARSYYEAMGSAERPRNFERLFRWWVTYWEQELEQWPAGGLDWLKTYTPGPVAPSITYDDDGKPENVLPIMSYDDLLALPDPEWLISGMVQEGSVVMIAGESGIGKSALVLQMLGSLATGGDLFDRPNPHPDDLKRVLYVCAEGFSNLKVRIPAMCAAHGYDVELIRQNVDFLEQGVMLSDRASMLKLYAQATISDHDVIVLDTLSALGGYEEENNAAEAANIVRSLIELRRVKQGATVIVVHHAPKGGQGPRGSGVWKANVDTVISCTGIDPKNQGIILSTEGEDGGKQKNAEGEKWGKFFIKDGAVDYRPMKPKKAEPTNSDWTVVRDFLIFNPNSDLAAIAAGTGLGDSTKHTSLDRKLKRYHDERLLEESFNGRTRLYNLPKEY